MVSFPGRAVNLFIRRDSEFFNSLAQNVRPFQVGLPDLSIDRLNYGQFSGCVKSNGAYDSIMCGDRHYKIKNEFYNGNG